MRAEVNYTPMNAAAPLPEVPGHPDTGQATDQQL